MWHLKNDTNELIYKARSRLTDLEKELRVLGGKVGSRDRLGIWDCHIYTTIFKIDNQQGPIV